MIGSSNSQNSKSTTHNPLSRSPIVVVMGHIDHGKTTLLDYIRKASVASSEAGGITQSIGAYEIIHTAENGEVRRLTFIDTPGHEAFSKMRSRGAQVADVGILVVAADDGVMPQTKEAIDTLREAGTPFVVAINKTDKESANIEKTKQSLINASVFLEGYGGDVSFQLISAVNGRGVGELIDIVALTADMLDLSYDANEQAKGIVVETRMNRKRGLEVSVIVKNGTLRLLEEIRTTSSRGKIKILENFAGEKASALIPSSPALIVGFETAPKTGEEFTAGSFLDKSQLQPAKRPDVLIAKAESLRVILKTDVAGSLEALEGSIAKELPEIGILQRGLGDITDSDIKIAISSNAIVVGFRVKIAKSAEPLIKAHSIKVISSEIIYELIDILKKDLEQMVNATKTPTAILEVLALFKVDGANQVIGGKVASGTVQSNSAFGIIRRGGLIGEGTILNLQKNRKDTESVPEGEECGMLIKSDAMVKKGDELAFDK